MNTKITQVLIAILIVVLGIGFYSLKNVNLDVSMSEHKNNVITISGKAEKSVSPDTAKISFSINEYNSNQKIATDRMNKKTKRILDALEDLDIDDKDIKTINYSVYPQYNWNNGKRNFDKYRASQTVNIKVRDLEDTPKVLALLGNLKADNVSGPNMFIDNRDEILDELREDAIKNAKRKAKELASELGVSLDKIVGFSENNNRNYYPQPMYKMAIAQDSTISESIEEPEIKVGEEKLTKTITISFQIQD